MQTSVLNGFLRLGVIVNWEQRRLSFREFLLIVKVNQNKLVYKEMVYDVILECYNKEDWNVVNESHGTRFTKHHRAATRHYEQSNLC